MPAPAVLLHIGPAKTGSTAMQHAMFQVREQLARHGVHYVGSRPHEKEAGGIALGLAHGAIGRRDPRPESWQRLVDEMATTTLPRMVLSNEDFGRADEAAIDRILTATGADRTHLVYVARRLDKVLPSHWQQQVKARMTTSYEDFLREMLDPDADTWRHRLVMDPQDVGAVLARWGKVLPPERMAVVVAEEGDREALPRAFEGLLGLPAGLIAPPGGPANQSMGLAETEAVRRINRLAIDEQWTPVEYRQLVQLGVVKELKNRAGQSGPRIGGVPAWAFERVAELADTQVDDIRSSGVNVVGDPDRLRVRGQVEPVDLPDEITAVDLDVLADVVSGLRTAAKRMKARTLAGPAADVRGQRDDLGGRQLLQLLARRTAARLGVRRG
ncbi:hypothetical protein EFL26_04270 [Nocardioides pocheonensis]|uniref:Sulfotransferase family protein n=1 Tax=Nocardioides pocheonensis TaxID=661485 RepID=A0A3N0GWB8_9ACTN|nr:hypothetical protein EFL26_04270 [Nocardioides pocheonensis]